MQFSRLKLRFRRGLKQQQQQVEDFGQQAEDTLERHLLGRFTRLYKVRRFIAGWAGLFLLLIGCLIWQLQTLSGYYQSLQPVPGGIYSEGIQGTVTNVNPIYATSAADSSLAHLIFAGLFTYNNQNQLVGNLASGYTVNASGTVYTVQLKPNLTWQDGQPLTSADVVFTYHTIQNPDAQSPLISSWQGITVASPNPSVVTFTLPSPLASFPYNLTTGIVPVHLLAQINPVDLRSANFNTQAPVGAGPFAWGGVQVSGSDPTDAQEQVGLLPFKNYVGGQPKVNEFIVHAYDNQAQLLKAFQDDQLTAVAGLPNEPAGDKTNKAIQARSLLLTAGTYVFFKTNSGVLSDPKVRQALVAASDPTQIASTLGYPTHLVHEPLLESQLAYDPAYIQQTNNLVTAQNLLTQDGWARSGDGVLTKAGQQLTFDLIALDTPEYRTVTSQLQRQWSQLGVKLQITFQDSTDYTTTLENHSYDATLYGISIGVDPDVFVYWDSSQNDPRSTGLNLSLYSNPMADAALEAGRTRLDPALRVIKYKPFLQAWQQDAPALGLYQPRYLYLTHGTVYGLTDHAINSATDRYNNVQNWEIRTAKTTN